MSIDSALSWLVRLSHEIGTRVPVWNQGAGGNLSWKNAQRMWIKASGMRLDQVSLSSGLVEVDRARLRWPAQRGDAAENQYAASLAAAQAAPGRRPSMETGFHAELAGEWILHFHSLPAILMAHHAMHDAARMKGRFDPLGKVAYVPPVLPGLELALAVRPLRSVPVLILQNHGVILQTDGRGEDVLELLRRWEETERTFCRDFGYPPLEEWGQREEWVQSFPLRHYFPDAAVFAARAEAQVEPSGVGRCRLKGKAWATDRDAGEIVQATSLLESLCRELEPFPPALAERLTRLPTEKHRQ